MTQQNLYNFTRQELGELLHSWGYSDYHTKKLWQGIYRDLVQDIEGLVDLRPDLRQKLVAEMTLSQTAVQTEQESSDGYTRKFLLQYSDQQAVETVIMRFQSREERPDETNRYTACISTQVGCAMGCIFCATGQMGFTRHLSTGDIVSQVLFVQRTLRQRGSKLRNIVLMGMGEPLHNYDNTMKAIDILTDHHGLSLAPRHITISTVGLPHRIRQMADEKRPARLAVSLHGATDAERQALVPPAKRWPLAELLDACRYYSEIRKQRIFFEWTLISYENDTPEQGHALGQLLQGMDAHINVIPLNPTEGYAGRPSDPGRVKAFQAILSGYGLPSTVRQRRGIDIAAGCGQLANNSVGRPDLAS